MAAALEWVKIGPTLQGRRGICYAFKLSILNFSADWQNAKHSYCTVTQNGYLAMYCVLFGAHRQAVLSSYSGTDRQTDTVVQFLCLFGEGIG